MSGPKGAPGTAPTRRPAAALAASLLAVLLVALAFVAVRDLAVTEGWTTGRPWSAQVVESLDGLGASTTVVAIGVAAAVVGLLLLWTVLRPSTRTHRRAAVTDADVWISAGAVATVAREAADRTPGVLSAETRARRRRIDVTVASAAGDAGVAERVQESIRQQLAGLDDSTIKVRVKEAAS